MNLDNWPKHIHKYLFLLKDDFFQLPYLYNSPEKMLEGLTHLPIAKHNIIKQFFSINSSFYKSKTYYKQIDEGFWILVTSMNIKENIVAISNYDQHNVNDYYFLNLSIFRHEFFVKDSKVTLANTTWSFNKPNTEVPNYFYNKTNGKIISFAFKKDWFKKKISSKTIKQKKAILQLLNNKRGFYRWTDITPNSNDLAAELSETIKNNINFDLACLKKKSMKLIVTFFENSFEDNRILENISLSNSDYSKVARAEKIISTNLHLAFVGIDFIAKEVNCSPTKLKTIFKIVYGFSMLKYHKEKNMLLAKQLITNPEISIQEIANITGYDSPSRFASSYKKRFGELPSEAR
ncbi:helix-turn-helix domain-containing protein [Flavobacterium sp. FlaQc-57]|uniref:helix-turn-helix domain-containing protein n=1 Tax=Flavobacterium sp. FlaQc-57 TaxID=3374186 RepID=UPI003756C71B